MTTPERSRSAQHQRTSDAIQPRSRESPISFQPGKIQAWHLDRLAIVYVRQSTLQQVSENTESRVRGQSSVPSRGRSGQSRRGRA
jgi:hypothetical protein